MEIKIIKESGRFIPKYKSRNFLLITKWKSFWYDYGDDGLLGLGLTERTFDTYANAEAWLDKELSSYTVLSQRSDSEVASCFCHNPKIDVRQFLYRCCRCKKPLKA